MEEIRNIAKEIGKITEMIEQNESIAKRSPLKIVTQPPEKSSKCGFARWPAATEKTPALSEAAASLKGLFEWEENSLALLTTSEKEDYQEMAEKLSDRSTLRALVSGMLHVVRRMCMKKFIGPGGVRYHRLPSFH